MTVCTIQNSVRHFYWRITESVRSFISVLSILPSPPSHKALATSASDETTPDGTAVRGESTGIASLRVETVMHPEVVDHQHSWLYTCLACLCCWSCWRDIFWIAIRQGDGFGRYEQQPEEVISPQTAQSRVTGDERSRLLETPSKGSRPSNFEDPKALMVASGVPVFPSRSAKQEAVLHPSKKNDSLQEFGDVCPTCLELYTPENPKIVTKCGHHFHLACIYEWLERSQTCPVCFRPMKFDEL